MRKFDLAVVGAGIVGLACALAAARRGLSVVVVERDARARGASVRNFGLVPVSGQDAVTVWPLARRSRETWLEVAMQADIPIVRRGLWVAAQRAESAAVLEAFLATDTAEGCELLDAATARRRCPALRADGLQAVLWSPHELRFESRDAIPALAAWLEGRYGVEFRWETAVSGVEPPQVLTSRGPLSADAIVVCPGDDRATLFPERLAAAGIGRCRLQMLRLENPGFTLPGTVMSDLSLIRYTGFAGLAAADALRQCLAAQQNDYLRHGIHLIIAQSADGSLVIGDSHHYDTADAAENDERVCSLLLDEYHAVTGRAAPPVRARWTGSYAVTDHGSLLVETPTPGVRLVVVTSGVGAWPGVASGEDVIEERVA